MNVDLGIKVKVLVTDKNTNWGVIQNPVAANVYSNILSFDNEEMKEQYITKFLFNRGEDFNWKEELSKQPPILFDLQDSITASFKVDIKDYISKGETLTSMLNKDFAIMEITEFGKTRYEYWTIRGTRETKGQGSTIITYEAELDVFFTYDIKDMFLDNEIEIERAHHERFLWNKKKDSKAVPILGLETPNATPEQFLEQGISESNYLPKKSYNVEYDITSNDIEYNSDVKLSKEEQLKMIKTILTNQGYLVCYSNDAFMTNIEELVNHKEQANDKTGYKWSIDTNAHAPIIRPYKMEGIIASELKSNFTVFTIPLAGAYFDNDNWKPQDIPQELYWLFHDNPNSQGMNITITGVCPFSPKDYKFKLHKVGDSYTIEYINNNGSNSSLQPTTLTKKKSDSDVAYKAPIFYKAYITDYDNESKGYDINDLGFDRPNYNIESSFHEEWEAKLYKSPYRLLRIIAMSGASFDIIPEYITNQFRLQISFNWSPTQNHTITRIQSDGIYSDTTFKYGLRHDDVNGYSMPMDSNSYREYQIRNKAQNDQKITEMKRDRIFDTIGGALGIGGSAVKGVSGMAEAGMTGDVAGGLSSGINMVGGISSGIQSIMAAGDKMKEFNALQKDIKNTPNKTTGTTSDLPMYVTKDSMNNTIYELGLLPAVKKKIALFFAMHGVNYAGRPMPIPPLLKTRYYYNYIQTGSVFENINYELTGMVRQVISDSMQKGLTIWHVRSLGTFKGIKNYTTNNIEMKYFDVGIFDNVIKK